MSAKAALEVVRLRFEAGIYHHLLVKKTFGIAGIPNFANPGISID